jgi:hypothetical protein
VCQVSIWIDRGVASTRAGDERTFRPETSLTKESMRAIGSELLFWNILAAIAKDCRLAAKAAKRGSKSNGRRHLISSWVSTCILVCYERQN